MGYKEKRFCYYVILETLKVVNTRAGIQIFSLYGPLVMLKLGCNGRYNIKTVSPIFFLNSIRYVFMKI